MAAPEPSKNRNSPRQFSLRGLLWFMVACSAYFSNFVFVQEALRMPQSLGWSGAVSVIILWLLVGAFYLRNRLTAAMVFHGFTPTVLVVLGCCGLLGIGASLGDIAVFLKFVATLGCSVSTLFSFPVSVLMILMLACGRKPKESE